MFVCFLSGNLFDHLVYIELSRHFQRLTMSAGEAWQPSHLHESVVLSVVHPEGCLRLCRDNSFKGLKGKQKHRDTLDSETRGAGARLHFKVTPARHTWRLLPSSFNSEVQGHLPCACTGRLFSDAVLGAPGRRGVQAEVKDRSSTSRALMWHNAVASALCITFEVKWHQVNGHLGVTALIAFAVLLRKNSDCSSCRFGHELQPSRHILIYYLLE